MSTLRKYSSNYWLILPFFALYSIFTLFPVLNGLRISFMNYQLMGSSNYVGFENYAHVLTDSFFWISMWHTVLYVLISVPPLVTMGFVLALIVNAPIKGKRFFQAIFFIPNILSISIIANIWTAVLGNYGGLFGTVLNQLGAHQQINWLASYQWVWVVLDIVSIWWESGFNMILYLAALQDIPDDVYEAAKIDGATPFQQLRYITIPSVGHVTVLVAFLQTVNSFQAFAHIYLLTQGGPAGFTTVVIQYIYSTAFQNFVFGTGAAMSFVFLLVMVGFSLVQLRLLGRSAEGRV